MAGVGKCMAVMTGVGLLGGAASSYYMQSKANKVAVAMAEQQAKGGKIKIGGRTPDGKMWDGEITIDDFKKDLKKKSMISAAVSGAMTAVGTALIAGLTLLCKAKLFK